jgi:hypothetical protein
MKGPPKNQRLRKGSVFDKNWTVQPERRTTALLGKADFLFLALFLFVFLAVFRDFFLAGRMIFERDTTVVEVPVRKLTLSLLRQGNLALWTDAYGNGQPFLANPKNAVFYPFTWLYLALPLFAAFRLYYLVHVVLGWLGLYVLSKSYGLTRRAAFLGASLFVFGGMYLSSFEFYNHIAALAWMPWVLLVLHRDSGRGRPRTVLAAVLWVLLILAGSPEILLMAAFLAAAQSFLAPGTWGKRLRIVVVPILLACLLAAAQLAPSFEMLSQTDREVQSVEWPLELLQLPDMAFPGVLGNDRQPGHHDFWGWHLFDKHVPLYYSLYMGFGALLLFGLGARRPWDRRKKVLLASFAVFFLLACGRYSPLFFLYRFTPFLSSIRYPVKFFLGSVFCLSILAAMGFDEATGARGPGKRLIRALAAAAGLSLLLFFLFKGRILGAVNALLVIEKETSLQELGRSIAAGLLLLAAYAAIFFLLHLTRGRAGALGALLIVLAVLDPAYHNRWINPTVPESFFARPPIMETLKPPLTVYRTEDYSLDRREKSGSNVKFLGYYRGTLYPLTGIGDGVRYVFNADFYGTFPKRYTELVREAKKLPPEGQLKILKSMGCDYFISDYALFSKEEARHIDVEGFPVAIEDISPARAAPYVVHAASRVTNVRDGLRFFTEDSFDPMQKVLTQKDVGLDSSAAVPPGSSVIAARRQASGFGVYDANLAGDGIAVFSGNRARGWRAWVDGRRAPVFEANLFAKGVRVPAGRHVIVLRYLPWSFLGGAAISLAAIVFLLAGAVVSKARLRRKVRLASP